eukprot:gene32832-42508_t
MEELPESKHTAVLDHMRDLLQKFVNKGLLEFTYVHHLLWEYTQELLRRLSLDPLPPPNGQPDLASKATRMDDLVSQLAECGPKLMSTKPGSRTMCVVASHACAKDRKRVIKTLKGHALESILHDSAYLNDEPLFLPTNSNPASSKKSPELRRKELLTYIQAIGRVFAGVKQELVEDEEADGDEPMEAEGEEAEYEEEEDAVGEDQVDMQYDEDEDDAEIEIGDDGGADEEDNNALLAELENMDEGDEPDLSKAKNNKNSSSEPDLPIEEDGIAHVLLKRLLNFEQSLDTQSLAEAVVEDNHLIDTSMWMHPHKFPERKVEKKSNKKKNKATPSVVENDSSSASGVSVSQQLLSHLSASYIHSPSSSLLTQWLKKNRPCFALTELLRVPSVGPELHRLLEQSQQVGSALSLDAIASQHAGGKLLLEILRKCLILIHFIIIFARGQKTIG